MSPLLKKVIDVTIVEKIVSISNRMDPLHIVKTHFQVNFILLKEHIFNFEIFESNGISTIAQKVNIWKL